jgi:hypothetical protein
VGKDACQVLLRAFEKVPAARFSSATEFVEALDQALETPPIWVLPEEYHLHMPSPASTKTAQLEGDITESLLKEVLLEQGDSKSPSKGLSKYTRVGGLALVATVVAFLATSWVVNSAQKKALIAGLTLASTTPPSAVVNQPYAFALQASGGRPPYQWAVVDGRLPEGLTLEPEGIIRGQSETTGTYDVRVQVKGAGSETAVEQQVSLTVRLGPKIKSDGTLAAGWAGRDYSYPLGVEGGQRPYRWAVTRGSIPPGLTLNTFSGFLGGRPEVAGTFRFDISVTDLFGATSTRPFQLTVKPAPQAVERIERIVRATTANSPPETGQIAHNQ